MKIKQLDNCKICPHECMAKRNEGQIGKCGCNDKIKVALVSLHYYEEPCISGKEGSGTIFFSNCNMHCLFCQNYEISQLGKGKEMTIQSLAEAMLEQQKKGANNINLVTPTTYAYSIKEAIILAKRKGLTLPIIYNSNGYEKVETLKDLEGYIDVYLPDLKYYTEELAKKYSGVTNYFSTATKAIQEMYRQVGTAKFDERGIIQKGIIVRHLVLPNHLQNSKHILKWIKENMPEDIYVSVMAQYFPTYKAKEDALINRKLTKKEYKEIEEYFYLLDIHNGYIQELGEHEEEYVPKWDM